jgi:hypothetical protein
MRITKKQLKFQLDNTVCKFGIENNEIVVFSFKKIKKDDILFINQYHIFDTLIKKKRGEK